MYSLDRLEESGLLVFRNYLGELWTHLNLPQPTIVQCEIADYLQYGPNKLMIEAFRGVGKSYIAAAWITHNWLVGPNLRQFVASATQDYANEMAGFIRQVVDTFELIEYMKPSLKQRQSVLAWDIGPALPEKSPSLKAAGIMGQLTGSRADRILIDDPEIPKNSFTAELRMKLGNQIKELGAAILKPLPDARVVYLGTPQSEQSIYKLLEARGYEIKVWPSEISKKIYIHGSKLGPTPARLVKENAPIGTPCDPQRFPAEELRRRRAEYGESAYALQFLLDTSPSDADRHPLKLRNLIVADLDLRIANTKYVWGTEANNRSTTVTEMQVASLEGDSTCYRAAWKSEEMTEYTGRVMFIDPSGQGKDETAYAVVFHLFGQLFLMKVGGFVDGFSPDTLEALADVAALYNVNHVISEKNFGGGMFNELLKPVLARKHPCVVEEVHHIGQKELRIIDTLRPIIDQHRLVVALQVMLDDALFAEQGDSKNLNFSLFYQFTRLTKERGCLPHEDRLDAVAGAVHYWVEAMARDTDRANKDHKQTLLKAELKKFMTNVSGKSINLGYHAPVASRKWNGRGRGRPSSL